MTCQRCRCCCDYGSQRLMHLECKRLEWWLGRSFVSFSFARSQRRPGALRLCMVTALCKLCQLPCVMRSPSYHTTRHMSEGSLRPARLCQECVSWCPGRGSCRQEVPDAAGMPFAAVLQAQTP